RELDAISDRRHRVCDIDRTKHATRDLEPRAELDGMETEHGSAGDWQLRKVGPHDAVEHVSTQRLDGFDTCMYLERMRNQTVESGIDEQRQSGHVIEMGVGE